MNQCQSQICLWNLNWDMDFTLNQKAYLNYKKKRGEDQINGFDQIAQFISNLTYFQIYFSNFFRDMFFVNDRFSRNYLEDTDIDTEMI